MKKLILIFLIALGGLSSIVVGLLLASDCEDTIKTEVRSPDGRYLATSYERDCGATTDFSTIVQLRDNSASFAGNNLGVVIIDGQHKIDLIWDGNRTLKFQCHDCSADDIFKQEKTWRDVEISLIH